VDFKRLASLTAQPVALLRKYKNWLLLTADAGAGEPTKPSLCDAVGSVSDPDPQAASKTKNAGKWLNLRMMSVTSL
jgi:hypothetical protein